VTQFDPYDCPDRLIFEVLKIQDSGGRHYEKWQNQHISAIV